MKQPLFRHRAWRGVLALVATCLGPMCEARAETQADMQLQTDLHRLSIHVDQSQPFPLGGCASGHSWHTTFGGCRREETVTEIGPCQSGWRGSRTRSRVAYVLQANASDVVYGEWSSWRDDCTPPRQPGFVDHVIAKVRGKENGEWSQFSTLSGNLAKGMRVNYGTMFGVTLHRPDATLNCLYASGTTPSSGNTANRIWYGRLLSPGQSIEKTNAGYCRLSQDRRSVELRGSCDRTAGGDSDHCIGATRHVRVTTSGDCSATTETLERGHVVETASHDLC